MSSKKGCGHCGPGYASPMDAYKNGERETLLYVVCVQPDHNKMDYLSTVDVEPDSETYCQIIHRTYTGFTGDEIHHTGWNVCSSCHGNSSLKRDKLVMPSLHSSRIFIVDTGKDPKKPEIFKVIDGKELEDFNCTFPHTTHCLASGDLMISTLGDKEGNAKGDFVLIDGATYKTKGTWTKGDKIAKLGYDFWYQPYHDIMVSSEWGAPKVLKRGFNPADVTDPTKYGSSLNLYSWSKRKLIQTIDLGTEGLIPLEVRFLHNPKEAQGFVGCALYSRVFRFYKKKDGTWAAHKVIEVPAKKVEGWIAPEINGLMTDILISLDDRFLYFSNWLHGDIRQYDISNPEKPKLTAQVFLGGKILKDQLKVVEDLELDSQPDPVYIKGRRLYGSPQMFQLSLDGKRLYVSSSLYSPWDKQFYPEAITEGSWIVKLDVDTENGGMTLDKNFLVDYHGEPDGPVLAHEIRYPGGDSSSDIWLVKE